MAKKDKYNYVSPASAGLGLSVTGAVSMIPGATPFAGPIGTMATGLFGGFNPTDEEMSIKDKFDESIENTWNQINDDYKLTDVCFSKLKQEVIGEDTSTDEFVDNYQRKRLEESYALVIQAILEMHRGGLERKSKKTWDDEYIKNASKDMAHRLISTLQNVFNEDDLLKILRAIADRSKDIRGDIDKSREANRLEHEQLMQILIEISESIKSKRINSDVPHALTTIPSSIDLIGRAEDIQTICDLLEKNDIVAIHAVGGVGKTALAVKVANQIKKDVVSKDSPFKHVAWITSTGNLKDDLTVLNIPSVIKVRSAEDKFQAASAFLQDTPTFLVIDNMDEPPTDDEIDHLNTIAGKTKILITTRADIPNVDEVYDLNVLDPEPALILFYRCFKKNKKLSLSIIKENQGDIHFAESIIEATGRNALFIELIGKMAYADHMDLDSLWLKLNNNIFSQDSNYTIHTDHAKSHYGNKDKLLVQIQKLYKMSKLSERQKEIVSFISLFPAEHSIFFDVFKWAGFEDDEEDNLGALQERGWIERNDDGYLIHMMVKGSVEQQNGKTIFDDDRYQDLVFELCKTSQYMPRNMVYTKIRERIIVPETICRLLAGKNSKTLLTSLLYGNLAEMYRAQGKYFEALIFHMKEMAITEGIVGKDNPLTSTVYDNIAGVLEDMGNYEEALNYFSKALAISEEHLGNNHIDTAIKYNNIAGAYLDLARYEEALKCYETALTICKLNPEQDYRFIAIIYDNIADIYRQQRKYEKALKNYKKSLIILRKEFGENDLDTATVYNNMGVMYFDAKDYGSAKYYLEKSLAIREKILGPEHPYTIGTRKGLDIIKKRIIN